MLAQRYRRLSWLAISTTISFILVAAAPAEVESRGGPTAVLFATFNASLNRFNAVDLISDLSTPGNAQAQAVAEIIQRTRPDVLLLNEFDFDQDGEATRLLEWLLDPLIGERRRISC